MHADNHADNVQSVAEYPGAVLECWIQDWWGVVRDMVYMKQHFPGARNAQFFSTSMILLQSVVKRFATIMIPFKVYYPTRMSISFRRPS